MNEILKNIQETIVRPEMAKIKQSVKGFVTAVYYQERKCDVVYFDHNGAQRTSKRLNLPEDGNGVFHESLLPGDRIELSFRGQQNSVLYISRVYKRSDTVDNFTVTNGQDLPTCTDLF